MPPRKPLVPPEVASLLIVDAQLIQMEFVRDESPKLTRTQHDHHPLNRVRRTDVFKLHRPARRVWRSWWRCPTSTFCRPG